MFDHIGSKIKSLAKIVCWAGIIISVLIGIVMLASGGDVSSPIGLVLMFAGPLCSWIGSFFVYGFGELIEKTTEIAENTRPAIPRNHPTLITVEGGSNEDKRMILTKWKEQGLITEEEYQEKIKHL